ncbi:MAG: sigma 54-interacting transcriptional regulator, partial [Deltaproteobacteria bacterium]|nr:sigma 54-interacting transcriptional regulator [Deltaproteobacteria bacterium]
GDLSLRVQTKLLQVLQERTFCKVGSHERLLFRGRVIAATNKRLLEMRRGGQFRDDLYYRLCSNTITLPPLEQRFREDPRELDLLLGHLVHRMTGDRRPAVAGEIREVLRRDLGDRYPWPGNVRELEQAVRSVLLVDAYGGDAGLTGDRAAHRLHRRIERGDIGWQELVAEYCRALYERHGSYGEVSRRTGLDWRTVKKHLAALDARRTAE